MEREVATASTSAVGDALAQVPLDAMQASLTGPNPPVSYEFVGETNAVNYLDRQAFEGYALQFADETKGIVELEAVDQWASELASMLYTYRSIARALPTVTGDEAQRRAMYSASFEVLHPAISRVKALISFKERACAKWTSNLALLIRAEAKQRNAAKGETPVPCEALYFQLLWTLDMLAVLDALKDTKACLNNDFSAYKRAFQNCRGDVPDAEQVTTENNLLQPFLANQQSLLTALRIAVQRMSGYDAVVSEMASLAIEHLENEWYLTPNEKFRLLRSAAHALWLLDPVEKAGGAVSAFSHKKIRRERFGRWFRRYPIVPMYGDMFANLQHILSRAPSWPTVNTEDFFATTRRDLAAVAAQYELPTQLPTLRTAVCDLTAEWTSILRRIKTHGGGDKCMLPRKEYTDLCVALVQLTLQGCRLMSNLSALLQEAIAHKCNFPCSDELVIQRSGGVEFCDYERALRYNFSDLERSALVELLMMLKGLQARLYDACGALETMIRRGIHEKCQYFIHETLGGTTRKAVKYEKKGLKAQLMQLRNMCADMTNPAMMMDERAMVSKDFKLASHGNDYPARAVAPSQTQLWLMRMTARALYDERSPYIKGSLMQDPDLPKPVVAEMRAFVSESAYFPYLLRLSATLDELGDVSCLWMREFYLELCKRVQFPISMSLAAILTEHILAANNSHLMPMLLAPFEIYSDAALSALRTHRQQHLFTEIEAEANLVFDQVLYSLSEQLFGHFKTRASVALLVELGRSDHDAEITSALGKCWYLPLLSTRHARILGRSVDLSRLLTQRMNSLVRGSLELALTRFEARSLDGVIDVHRAIRVTRLTHALLSEHLPQLDAFDAIFNEVNDGVAFLSFSSRILTHAQAECLSDLIPHFAFRLDGHAFQRPLPTTFTSQPERDPAPKAAGAHLGYGTKQLNAEFAVHAARASGIFGAAHAEALVSVLGESGVQTLLATLNKHVEELLMYAVHSYVTAVQEALPESIKLPSYQYGAQGCFLFFEAKLKDLANYEELHSGVLHSLRRLGNCFCLLSLLDSAVRANARGVLHQLPPQGSVQPLTTAATAVSAAWGQAAEESDMVLMAEQLAALSAPLASSASLQTRALIHAANVVSPLKEAWLAGEKLESDLSSHDETRAFHRVWSAVKFLYATTPYDTESTGLVDNTTLFGDGVLFAGSFLLHVLCQRHRFELLDFASHVHAVHEADPPPASAGVDVLKTFVHQAGLMRAAHEQFAALLDACDAPTVYNVWRRF